MLPAEISSQFRSLIWTAGVQFGGDEVVQAKDGAGSATLSMAYAGYRFELNFFHQKTVIIRTDHPIRFAEAVIKALRGEAGIVEPTFVYLPGIAGGDEIAKATGVEFFSTLVTLGVNNVHPRVAKHRQV